MAFQAITIDGAQFQKADLSEFDRATLESITFASPPTYDDQTRFPANFDPVAQRWKRVTK